MASKVQKKMQSNQTITAKMQLIGAMTIFGTIGLFVRWIPLSSGIIALARGVIGTLFLLGVLAVSRRKIRKEAVRKNILVLILSGAFIGFNWILLFEAYRYTTVVIATLCYYLAPVFVTIVAPFVLKEKMTARKFICVIVALIGMMFVSGIVPGTTVQGANPRGIIFGIGAAIFYAAVIVLNQKLIDIEAYDRTIMQLGIASAVLLPYVLLTEDMSGISCDINGIALLLVVGVVHTGMSYMLYFASMKNLPAQTVAIFGYIDPVVAILLSVGILHEQMNLWGIVGAILILCSTAWNEMGNN